MATVERPLKLVSLPQELLELIISKLWARPNWKQEDSAHLEDIRSIRLTCRRLQVAALPFMYRIRRIANYSELDRFMNHMRNRPHLKPLIKGIEIDITSRVLPQTPLEFPLFTNIKDLILNGGPVVLALLFMLPKRTDIFPQLEICNICAIPHRLSGGNHPTRFSMAFTELLPIVTAPRLRKFSIEDFDIHFLPSNNRSSLTIAPDYSDTSKWPVHFPAKLSDLDLFEFNFGEQSSRIGEAMRGVRGTKGLIIRNSHDAPGSVSREIVNSLADNITDLWYDAFPRTIEVPHEHNLLHCTRLKQLRITSWSLCCLLMNSRYRPIMEERQSCIKFPISLESLTIDVKPYITHRGALYWLLLDMINRHLLTFPNIQCLTVHILGVPEKIPSLGDSSSIERWSKYWDHHRVAPAESEFVQIEEGEETNECKELRSACENREIMFRAIDIVTLRTNSVDMLFTPSVFIS